MDLKGLMAKLATINMTDILETVKRFERRTWIYIGAGVFAGILFFLFSFYPGWCKRPVVLRQSVDLQNQMSRLKAMSLKKPQLEKQKKEIQDFIAGFQKRLFSEAETPFLLGKISKVAQDSEVELVASKPVENVEPFPDPYAQKYKKFIYHLTAEGSYHRIGDFISRLEAYPQHFQIQSLDINSQADKAGKQIAEIKLMAVSHNADVASKEPAHA